MQFVLNLSKSRFYKIANTCTSVTYGHEKGPQNCDPSVIRLGLANRMLCIDNQVVDIALPVVYTLRTRQCFNVLRHFSSDSANLIIFRDVHAILNVKVSAIGISTLAVIVLSNLNYFVSFEISMLV